MEMGQNIEIHDVNYGVRYQVCYGLSAVDMG